MCLINLYIIILKFLQIAWPAAYMNNLEECFYHVPANFIFLDVNTCHFKKHK